RPLAPQAPRRAVPRDAVRAPPLLPVRPRGRVARPRLRQRLVRPLAHYPPRVAAGAGRPRGSRARAGVEAPLRVGRGADAGAVLPRGALVAAGARRGAGRAPAGGGAGGRGSPDPARERTGALPALEAA